MILKNVKNSDVLTKLVNVAKSNTVKIIAVSLSKAVGKRKQPR